MDPFEFIESYKNKHFDPQWEGRVAIIFKGHELYRGSGGVRRMIMPRFEEN